MLTETGIQACGKILVFLWKKFVLCVSEGLLHVHLKKKSGIETLACLHQAELQSAV